jgi:hypothetical protein
MASVSPQVFFSCLLAHLILSTTTVDIVTTVDISFHLHYSFCVYDRYDARATLRGPWKEDGSEHRSELHVHHEMTPKTRYDTAVTLTLEQDSYVVKYQYTESGGLYSLTTDLTMSRYA